MHRYSQLAMNVIYPYFLSWCSQVSIFDLLFHIHLQDDSLTFLSLLSCPSKGPDIVANVLFRCGKDCVIVVLPNMDGAEKGFVCDPCFVQALDQTLAQCLRY